MNAFDSHPPPAYENNFPGKRIIEVQPRKCDFSKTRMIYSQAAESLPYISRDRMDPFASPAVLHSSFCTSPGSTLQMTVITRFRSYKAVRFLVGRAFSTKPKQPPPDTPNNRSFELPCATQPARFKVSPAYSGSRLDRFIKSSAPGLPPGLIHRHIRQSRVEINGRIERRRSTPVRTDDLISFPGEVKLGLSRRKKRPPPDDVSLAEAMVVKQWLLYRDARVAALNKPPGLPVLAEPHHETTRTLEQLLCGLGTGRYWLVHRLQAEIGGVILVARDVSAAALLSDFFRARMVTRIFWGLVAGVPQHKRGVIDIDIGGKKAVTRYRVVQMVDNHYSWLELEPRTGRINQLSIHCAEGLGTPIVGDRGFDGMRETQHPVDVGALQLCSRSITFPRLTQVNSSNRQRHRGRSPDLVTVDAPLPPHMRDTWRRLGMQERFADDSC